MYQALNATSETLKEYLEKWLDMGGNLGVFQVTFDTPHEMNERNQEGVSLWLYRVIRDDQRLNDPPERLSSTEWQSPPLPLRLHYLVTPITKDTGTEQLILGKVLQAFHTHPTFRGIDLRQGFEGTNLEFTVRLEPMSLEEITRVWEALEGSYQLSVSYEVGPIRIATAAEPERITPVTVTLPEYGLIVPS